MSMVKRRGKFEPIISEWTHVIKKMSKEARDEEERMGTRDGLGSSPNEEPKKLT
jgi:hypothetical protein